MKYLSAYILLLVCLFFASQAAARQQQQDPTGLNQEIDYHIDKLGDATLELRMKMNAMQWQSFKASPVATNPTIFKRDMERQMASYILEDLKTNLNENDRTSLTSLKAKGMAQYKGKGQWEVKLDMKNPNVTKVSDNCYLLTGNMVSGGTLIHQLQKLFLPEAASDIKQDTDTFGNAIITYKLDVEPAAINLFAIAGIVCIVAGAAFLFIQMRKTHPVTPQIRTMATIAVFMLALTACSKDSGGDDDIPEPNPPAKQENIAAVDDAVQTFMTKHNVPAVSVAITKDEKLVYVKSYGYADKEAKELATTSSLFRLASVSKSVTAIALMKLIEDKKLTLDSKVFGTGTLLGTQYGKKPYSSNLTNITVRHLLQHTSGGWGNSVNDAMFLQQQLSADELITWALDNQTQKNAPGQVYDYSNFGYCLLAKIVEKVTGQTYEQYVKKTILEPLGIKTMTVGGNTLADRKPNEVKYYGTSYSGIDPYIYNIVRMDANGGWIASAKDLAKLLVHVDGYSVKQDILSAASITTMTTAPTLATPSGYACGWSVNNSGNWWHLGALPGTVTEIVRTSKGFNWAILSNTRGTAANNTDLDGVLWKAVNDPAVKWQDIDQF